MYILLQEWNRNQFNFNFGVVDFVVKNLNISDLREKGRLSDLNTNWLQIRNPLHVEFVKTFLLFYKNK